MQWKTWEMPEPAAQILEILRILVANQVEFIIVGGVCAVLQGSPITTFDL